MPKSSRTTLAKKKKPTPRAASAKKQAALTPDYQDYLERYAVMGAGRPKLSPTEFDKLDDELLDLLDKSEHRLSDEEIVRLEELEYLLIDAE